MKKVLFVFATLIFLSTVTFSQVSKDDISFMMKQVGASTYNLNSLEIRGYRVYYTDGSRDANKTIQFYHKTDGTKKNTYSLFDRGIQITTEEGGKKISARFIPYSEMSFVFCTSDQLIITLREDSM